MIRSDLSQAASEIDADLSRINLVTLHQLRLREERELIVSADCGPLVICTCGRVAIPSLNHCTKCAP